MTSNDIPAVATLEARLQAASWTSGKFSDALAAGYRGRLVQEAGNVAAFTVVMPGVDEDELLVIGVAPEHQRRGLASTLLAVLLEETRAAGKTRLVLEVRPSNTVALAFYRHHGFAEIGRRRGYYPARGAGDSREDALLMAKSV